MIYVCPVLGCGRLYEQGEDHRANEPCPNCWRAGWRTELDGTPYRLEGSRPMPTRIVLAHDASAAWLESLPELSAVFRNDAEVDAFAERVAAAGFILVVAKAAAAVENPAKEPA